MVLVDAAKMSHEPPTLSGFQLADVLSMIGRDAKARELAPSGRFTLAQLVSKFSVTELLSSRVEYK